MTSILNNSYVVHGLNAAASAGVGYVGKVAYDYSYGLLTGQGYAPASNLSSFASGAAILYVINTVTRKIFDAAFGPEKTAADTIARGIVAVSLTSLAIIPLNVTLAVKGILVLIPAIYLGEQIVHLLKHKFTAEKAG